LSKVWNLSKGPHVINCEHVVAVHLDNPSQEAYVEDAEDMEEEHKEEDGMRVEGADEARMIGYT
jgi:hypothetical protein